MDHQNTKESYHFRFGKYTTAITFVLFLEVLFKKVFLNYINYSFKYINIDLYNSPICTILAFVIKILFIHNIY